MTNYPKGTDHTASVIRYMKEREQYNPFFRAETTHSQTLNDGALNGYHGISAFTSSANVSTTLFMKSLGYSAKNTYNRYLFEESSPVSNLFLGLKYMIDRDGKDKSSTFFRDVNRFGDTTLLENQAYLPLGFLTETGLKDLDFGDGEDAFGFQNDLFRTATGLDGNVWHIQSQVTLLGSGVTISDDNGFDWCNYRDAIAHSNIIYSFTADRDGFLCIHLDLPKRNDYYVSVNGLELYKESISLPQMMAVGDVKQGDVIDVRINLDKGEASTMTVRAGILDMDHFWAGYEILKASPLNLVHFDSTYLEGIITCDRDGLLYTSIPQNGNWIARVDGKAVQTVKVGDCMLALELTEGEHLVSFRYENPAFSLAWKISALCAAIFAGAIWLDRKRKTV